MEAAVAEKGPEMMEWNDGRLDDLSKWVDRIEKKIDYGFDQVHRDTREIHVRLDGIQRNLIQIAWTFGLGMLTLASGLVGLIAVKL